ncbi:hypothetical protein V8C86DRAFT_2520730 [Haematococcus lacustris]
MNALAEVLAEVNKSAPKQVDKEKKKAAAARKPAAKAADGKANLKGNTSGFVAAARPATTANILAASHATGSQPDPSKAPLGKRVKDILDALLKHNGTRLTAAQLQQDTGHNLADDLELLREAQRHPRIAMGRLNSSASGGASSNGSSDSPAYWFTYRPEIEGVHDKISLLNYVCDLKGRAALADLLRKCYLTAGDDLQALKREGKIFIIGHVEPELETVFECDMMGQQVVSQDVRNLWFEVTQEHIRDRVPSEITDLQAAVLRAGLRSALANQPIKRTAPAAPKQRAKKPRQQRFNLEKATNAHLPQLFSGAQPVNIDS